MEYLHIKKLEEYHPKYKDRTLQWAKIYFKMAQGDPDCEMLDELDWGRLIRFILLELEAQQPIPLNDTYLTKKGFDLKKRPISLTIKMLHNFVDTTTQLSIQPCLEEEKEKEKEKDSKAVNKPTPLDFISTLKSLPLYSHINIDHELEKMAFWIKNHPGRKLTPRFAQQWLNKIEKPIEPLKTRFTEALKDCGRCGGTGEVYAPGSGQMTVCSCRKEIK